MRILLLAGGGGTRLWPLSTHARPKPFLRLLSRESLLAETVARLSPLSREIYVALHEQHVARLRRELRFLPAERILSEPERRNSGPPVLLAALAFAEEGDPVTAAVPSDQTVADPEAFRRALSAAARLCEQASVVVLAVPPTRPEADFGYLEVRGEASGESLEVTRFVEKPGTVQAAEYLQAGYLWNAGIFVFRPTRLLAEARRVAGDFVRSLEEYRERLRAGDSKAARETYGRLPVISIDHAVMEKASGVHAVPLRAGWSDVGTWRSVRDLRGPSDDRGNLIMADVPVLAPGVRDAAIVLASGGLLVLPLEREGELKSAVERLEREEPASKTS
jgi:mannose-1-phosphate guanylyltransferase